MNSGLQLTRFRSKYKILRKNIVQGQFVDEHMIYYGKQAKKLLEI